MGHQVIRESSLGMRTESGQGKLIMSFEGSKAS